MQKIPTMFVRDWKGDRSRVLDVIVVGCEWVATWEGEATRKYDGTCCLVRDHHLYKRHEVKAGKETPQGFEEVERDETTGDVVGWVPVGTGPEDRWHRDAFSKDTTLPDGTYELVGPKIQGNPDAFQSHTLVRHGGLRLPDAPRTFDGLKAYFEAHDIEGIVFHHHDGRMAKIKARDFGIKRTNRYVKGGNR